MPPGKYNSLVYHEKRKLPIGCGKKEGKDRPSEGPDGDLDPGWKFLCGGSAEKFFLTLALYQGLQPVERENLMREGNLYGAGRKAAEGADFVRFIIPPALSCRASALAAGVRLGRRRN